MPNNQRPYRLAARVLRLLACGLIFSATGLGQTELTPNDELVCGLSPAKLSVVWVEITDASGVPVAGLKADDFLVWEDGVKQTLDLLKQQEIVLAGRTKLVYHLGYYSTNNRLDGAFRSIRLDLPGKEERKLKGLYWPTGYFARAFD